MNVWFFMKWISHLMLKRATIKDEINPIKSKMYSSNEKCPPLFIRSRPVAAAIVGTEKKKENSTMVFLLIPRIKPPIIVAAERETPGIMATVWQSPMMNDLEEEISESSSD